MGAVAALNEQQRATRRQIADTPRQRVAPARAELNRRPPILVARPPTAERDRRLASDHDSRRHGYSVTGEHAACHAPACDVMLAQRKVRSNELAKAIGITESNLSLLKSGKVKGVRFSTLAAICRYLRCEPGDILGYEEADEDLEQPE